MVEEVRRQFREIPGLREGTAKPNYAAAVDISTRTALRLMVVPGAIPVVAPIVVGVFLGWAAVGALVVGATLSAIPLAIMMMWGGARSEEHTSELQSLTNLVCRLLLEKKKKNKHNRKIK